MTRTSSFLRAFIILTLSFNCTDDNTQRVRRLAETSRSKIPIIAPDNDNCSEAVMLQIGDSIEGTTFGATLDSLPSCMDMGYLNVVADVWYKFRGDGSPILVSTSRRTHNDSNTVDTFLSIYQGSRCGQLECLPSYWDSEYDGDLTQGGKSVVIESTGNTTYYVHVSNRNRDSRSSPFFLSISAYAKPIHGECAKAGEIIVDGDPVRGVIRRSTANTRGVIRRSTANATRITPCGFSNSFNENYGYGMAWYRINVTKNATLRASTCLGQSSGAIRGLSVVRGDCDGQTCLAESFVSCHQMDGGPFFDFDVIADGSKFFIIVWGYLRDSTQLRFFELGIHTFNPPDNDYCEAAVGLIVDGPSVTGTLFDSTAPVDDYDYSCGHGDGVWYSFIGTGNIVSASSCSDVYSHSVSIYKGECGNSLNCFAPPRFVIPKGCYSNGGTSAPVQTIKGVMYHVYVRSFTGTLIHGTFTLSIKAVTSPSNDEFSGAIEVVPDDNLVVIGNTVNVIYDVSLNRTWTTNECPRCASQSPALWYLIRGTGAAMRADAPSTTVHFYTVISILKDPYSDNSCLGWSNNRCDSWVIWQTEPGVDYYIRVAAEGDDRAGEFGLRVSSFERAVNDDCTGAIELMTGVPMSVSMEGAFPGDSSDCIINNDDFDGFSTPGLWYYVDGLGNAIEISTCDPASGNGTFSGRIQVFRGSSSSCTSTLVCLPVIFGNCFSPVSASVKFLAEEGERYYILFLSSWVWDEENDEENGFSITATNFDAATNDVCEGALPIDHVSLSIHGSTENSLPDFDTCKGYSSHRGGGVWYTLQGTGKPMAVSACPTTEISPDYFVGVKASVFVGSCNDLACVAHETVYSCDARMSNDDVTSFGIAFHTEVDTKYHILVASIFESTAAEFDLRISEVETPVNDLCQDAIEIVPDSGTVHVNAWNATSIVTSSKTSGNNKTSCSLDSNSPGVWYSLKGTGLGYVLSTCLNGTMPSAVSVSSGSCDRMKCITIAAFYSYESYNSCWGRSADRVVIRTEMGVDYFFFVHAADSHDRGSNYGLTVTSFDLAPNDLCLDAFTIVPDNATIFGSTEKATDSGPLGCSIEDLDMVANQLLAQYQKPDIWYRVDGTGTLLAVFPSGYQNFDPRIEILEGWDGTCATLLCVTSSDKQYFSSGRVVEWFATLGKTYFIRVFGRSSTSGRFHLSLGNAISNSSVG